MRTQYLFLPCILAVFWNKSTATEPHALNNLVCTWKMSHFIWRWIFSLPLCNFFGFPSSGACCSAVLKRLPAHIQGNLLTYPVYGSLLWYETGKSVGEILKYGRFKWKLLSSTFQWYCFLNLCKVVVGFVSVDEILKCDHSNETWKPMSSLWYCLLRCTRRF